MEKQGSKGYIPTSLLRQARIRLGYTQLQLADMIGSTEVSISRWENGKKIPSLYYRNKLSEALHTSLAELGLDVEKSSTEITTRQTTQSDQALLTTATDFSYKPSTPEDVWSVPFLRNVFFTGRTAILSHLQGTFLTEEGYAVKALPQFITGMGGIGKTQIALEYAYRSRHNYKFVLWVRADSSESLVTDYLLIATRLEIAERNDQDQSLIVKAVLAWLDTHENWLLIFDNVDHLETVRAFLPTANKGHILLTTRLHTLGTVAQAVPVDVMDLEEGTLFLLRRARMIKNNNNLDMVDPRVHLHARLITQALGSLPLALDQAGAYIEETECGLVDYLKHYTLRAHDLLLLRGSDEVGHAEPVATTWSLSFEKVSKANPVSVELLRLCAFLQPDAISEEMLRAGAAELPPTLQAIFNDPIELNNAIRVLLRYSLLRREKQNLQIHRLMQLVLKETLSADQRREWAEYTIRLVKRAFPNVEFKNWDVCQQYLPHVKVCMELISQEHITFREATQLLNLAGRYLLERGQYAEAEQFLQNALVILEQGVGAHHLDVAQTLDDLAVLYLSHGRLEQPEQLFLRALAIRKENLGEEHADIASIIDHMAALYRYEGDYKQSETFYQRALHMRKTVLGSFHPKVAATLNNMAILYYEQGKYKQAEQMHLQALDIREQEFSQEHPNAAMSLSNLGLLYWKVGRYAEAETFLQRALIKWKHALGEDHPHIATALNNLGRVYLDQGRYEQAEVLLLRSLAIRENMLSPDHYHTAYSLNNLGRLYHEQGQYDKAKPFYLRALTIREKYPKHPDLAETLEDLAQLYYDMDEYKKASALFLRAIAMREQNQGLQHPDLIRTLQMYAALLRTEGDLIGATTAESRARSIRTQQEQFL